MAPSIQVFLQVFLLCCVVTTCIGGITDWQKAFSQLENKVKQLEKRLEPLEAKGEFGSSSISSPCFSHMTHINQLYYLTPIDYSHCITSPREPIK